MAFAQLTYRESLRDIEACLRAQSSKLYHMGIRGKVSRSTLADANETRDWRIYADLDHSLIPQAHKLYLGEDFGVELDQTVYALDATTIDLCLSLFPWAEFRKTKSAINLHTRLDLRGSIPTFIHISEGKVHEVNILDEIPPETGAIYAMDRGYLDFFRLQRLIQALAFFVIRAKSISTLFGPRGPRQWPALRPDHCPHRTELKTLLPGKASPDQGSRSRNRQDHSFAQQQFQSAVRDDRPALPLPLASRTVLQMDQTKSEDQIVLRDQRECG